MGFLKKLKDTAEKGLEKGTEISKKGIEKGTELGKQGTEKISEAKENHKKSEDKKISDWLEPGEEVVMSATQKRIGGASIVSPTTVYVTEKRIIVKGRDQRMFGFTNSYTWDEVSAVRYIRYALVYSLIIAVPGMDELQIDFLPKSKVKEIAGYADERTAEARKAASQPNITVVSEDDPLTLLKKRFVKGEITKEEYDEMKKVLE